MSDVSADSVSQPGQAEAGRWLSIQDAAHQLSVSERTIYRRADRGQLQRRTLPDARVEVWVPDAELTAVSDVSADAVSQERAVLLVDRVSQAVTRQLEALTVELAASRERIEVLARENGTLTERSVGLERELATVRQASDADRQRIQDLEAELREDRGCLTAELAAARATVDELRAAQAQQEAYQTAAAAGTPARASASLPAPWWRRWRAWLAAGLLAAVVGSASCQTSASAKHAGLCDKARDSMDRAARQSPVTTTAEFWSAVNNIVDVAAKTC
jgi:hypothetical protein